LWEILDGLLEGIRVGLRWLDESLELPRNPGPEYAAYLCSDLEEIPVQILSPNLFERGQNNGQRITVAHALGALPCGEIEIPDYVRERAQQYEDSFMATREGML